MLINVIKLPQTGNTVGVNFPHFCTSPANASVDVRLSCSRYDSTAIDLIENCISLQRMVVNNYFKVVVALKDSAGTNYELSFADVVQVIQPYEEPEGGNSRHYYLRCSFVGVFKQALDTIAESGRTLNTSSVQIKGYYCEEGDGVAWTLNFEIDLTEFTAQSSAYVQTLPMQEFQAETDPNDTDYVFVDVAFNEWLPNDDIFIQTLKPADSVVISAYPNNQNDSYDTIIARTNLVASQSVISTTGQDNTTSYQYIFGVHLRMLRNALETALSNYTFVTFVMQLGYVKRVGAVGTTGQFLLSENHVGYEIISLPIDAPIWQLGTTTTEYKKGDITAVVKLDISTRAASIQSQVESNSSILTYRLYNDSYDFAGVGTYQSKVEVTDAEQGAMNRNTINVAFEAVPVGSYTLECSIDYNGTIYTESITINVVHLTLGDFGINLYLSGGYVLNMPIFLSIGVTTGSSSYQKPSHAKIVISCNETGKSMTRYFTYPYGGNNYVDLRSILPTYFDAANAAFTLNLTGYMYNDKYVQYNEGESTLNINILGVCLPIRGQEHTTPKSCINNYERLKLIIPQMLEPKCGTITKMWLLHYDENLTLYKNGIAAQSLAVDNQKKFNTTLVTFDDLTAVFCTKIGNNIEYTIRPQIVSNCEQMAVKFDAPLSSIEMPIFEMEVISNHFELGDVKKLPIYPADVLRLNAQSYIMPSNNQIITLRLRGLNAGSVWYYNNILRTQPTLLLSYTATDAESFERYYVTNIQVTEPTDGVDNGQITLSLKSNDLQW